MVMVDYKSCMIIRILKKGPSYATVNNIQKETFFFRRKLKLPLYLTVRLNINFGWYF